MKFNTKAKNPRKIKNHEGSVAFSMSPEMELYSAVATSTLSNSFYENSDDQVKRIQKLIKQCEPEFVAKLAVYARESMYLRSIPLVLTVELAKVHNGDNLVSRTVERVIQRPDEITELLSYYAQANNRKGEKKLLKISNQIQKGLARSFYKFNEYQFQKYNRKTDIRLRDVFFLTHPKARIEEEQILFDKIANDTLKTPETWEVKMSAGEKSKKEVWEELIDNKKLGYMACLRNLNNIISAGVSTECIEKVCEYIENENAVLHSKQLPFRFLSAYRAIGFNHSRYASPNVHVAAKRIGRALEKAIQTSIQNMKFFNEKDSVLIASDVSGSMQTSISDNSSVELFDIGILLGNLMHYKVNYSTIGIFGDTWKPINTPDAILAGTNEMHRREGEVGYSTNAHEVLKWALKEDHSYNRICIFSDLQLWKSNSYSRDAGLPQLWKQYKKKFPGAKLYLFDLKGYGHAPIDLIENDVTLIAGWSEKVFEMLHALENGSNALTEINNIEI